MAKGYDIADLEAWDARIREQAIAFGLDCYPQEFELCDHVQMLGYMAYSGMPAHFPHWSYGKSYERLKTLYDHGVSGLPYEMVINANPSLAYLMRENSLCLQITTIAHVYGHNDFFKNNATFRQTEADRVLARFKNHAARVRAYAERPSVGQDKVEAILDAAQALALNRRRNMGIRVLGRAEQMARAERRAAPAADPYRVIHARAPHAEADLARVPLEPDEDLLLFIRDHNPLLQEWERDLLGIVHDEAGYFIPQIETKIMNEGWATYWHHRIMNALDLPADVRMEFMIRHNQVVQPVKGDINPYHLGLRVWQDIVRRHDAPTAADIERFGRPASGGQDKIFEVRETDRDVSFLRRFLTPELMRDLDLFTFAPRGGDLVVDQVSDEPGWQDVKETLLRSVGMGAVPILRVLDADMGGTRRLRLAHEHDGRDLQLAAAEKTLAHVQRLWGREVVLETRLGGKAVALRSGPDGFAVQDR